MDTHHKIMGTKTKIPEIDSNPEEGKIQKKKQQTVKISHDHDPFA